jgi:predicted lipoprotein with Yx(FWY)xxD motif
LHRARVIPVASVILGMALAACGSSHKSSSSATSSPPATTSSAPAATSSTASATPVVMITTKHNKKLGTILGAGPKQLTVYLFMADKGPTSSCTGACASVWPPVTGKPTAGGKAMSADLGMITRADGTTQVTYRGHPLYFYVKDVNDGDPGDAYGEAIKSFGAEWYALKPSGQKVDLS